MSHVSKVQQGQHYWMPGAIYKLAKMLIGMLGVGNAAN